MPGIPGEDGRGVASELEVCTRAGGRRQVQVEGGEQEQVPSRCEFDEREII